MRVVAFENYAKYAFLYIHLRISMIYFLRIIQNLTKNTKIQLLERKCCMANIFNQGINLSYDRRVDQITAESKGLNIELLDVKSIPLREVNAAKSSIGSTVTSLSCHLLFHL